MSKRKYTEKNVDWLLEHAGAPVRYLTHYYLLRSKKDTPQMNGLWHAVEDDEEVVDIFSKQLPDGSWCAGGAWANPPSYAPKGGCTPVSPKYVTTAWLLWLLGDMGFNMRDKRIRRACDNIFAYQRKDGYIAETRPDSYKAGSKWTMMPCRFAIILIGLGKVGAADDHRFDRSYDLLAGWQQSDGGWILQKHKEEHGWDRSCPWSTFHATYALYASQRKKYRKNVQRGLDFLLHHLSGKDPDDIRRFFYHGHSTVHELLMFTEYGVGEHAKPVKTIQNWLMEMYDSQQGCFLYRGKPVSRYSCREDAMDPRVARYRLHHLIEPDWFTYYMTRIAVLR